MNEKEFDVDVAAYNLFKIFKRNSIDNAGSARVTEEGLGEMSSFFGTVPKDERGWVFIAFLGTLYEAGYSYDMTQFMGMQEVDE